MCVEAMAYEQLSSFKAHIPPSVLGRVWQPPRLLKILRQLDPLADQELELFMGPPYVEGVKPADYEYQLVGKYTPLGYRWLHKNYSKLGSCLHVGGELLDDEVSTRSYLQEVVADMERAQRGTILSIATIRPVSFMCPACNQTSSASEYYVREVGSFVECLNAKCGAEFVPLVKGDDISFQHHAGRAPCPACKELIVIEIRHREDGKEFPCPSCHVTTVLRLRWGLALKADK